MSSNFKDRVYIATTANVVMFFSGMSLLFWVFYAFIFLQFSDFIKAFLPILGEGFPVNARSINLGVLLARGILLVGLVISILFFVAGYGLKFRYRWGKRLFTIVGSLLVGLMLGFIWSRGAWHLHLEENLPVNIPMLPQESDSSEGTFIRKIFWTMRAQIIFQSLYILILAGILTKSLIKMNRRRMRIFFK